MMIATPALVAILGGIFLKERISPKGYAGHPCGGRRRTVIGRGTTVTSRSGGFGRGDAIMLLSVLNWAVFLVISGASSKDLPPAFAIFWRCCSLYSAIPFAYIMGMIFCDPTFMPAPGARDLSRHFPPPLHISYGSGPSIFTVAGCRVPVPSAHSEVVIAYFLVGERFTPWLFAGGAMILSGVWLVNRK